eukprot:CAMPEP_0184752038 /NCGR_PEP_ID=MMETSP0315-20130426/43371_1 /TAXON_ID=101924 /ORGANISM="Rhodosorus marinus, Strain UTEX LB 2760" /LENGTH=412 /DNA_ID=CAMNT_0027231351 /DNA_START=60 /DNA_END=1299 /DNA_ORIENTATION=-
MIGFVGFGGWRLGRGSGRRVCVSASAGDGVTVVVGATGRTGKLVVKKLLADGGSGKVRALVRDEAKALELLGTNERLEVAVVDVKDKDERLMKSLADAETLISCLGSTAIPSKDGKEGKTLQSGRKSLADAETLISCLGSTAIPSKDWEGGKNSPIRAVGLGMNNVIELLAPEKIKKVVVLSAVATRNRSFIFKVIDLIGGAWTAMEMAENAVISGAAEKGYEYVLVHAPVLKDEGPPVQGVGIRLGDVGKSISSLRRENAASVCVECARRELGDVVDISPYGLADETTEDWDGLFEELTKCPVVLKLEFSSLNKEKFQNWLLDWASALPTNSALFPPLPVPFRVDPTDEGTRLAFIRVTVDGSVLELGALNISLEESALVVRREPATREFALPGERDILRLLVESLDRVVN